MKDQRPLNYSRHLIDEDDIQAVVAVLRGDLITQGPIVELFEAALVKQTGAKHAIAVSNGTAALHLACLAADMKPGDVGVTSALTFVASANAMRYCGADVKLTDIDPQTLCMSPSSLEAVLKKTPEVSVIIPVHFSGLTTDAKELRRIAGDRIIIEDAAHALGARYENGHQVGCGDYADMTTLSFHPVKPITTGEGGAVLTNDDALAHRLRLLRTHGIERDRNSLQNEEAAFEGGERRPWYFEQQYLGFNYRLTDIQAALGLSQINKLNDFVGRRRKIAARYDQAFAALNGLTPCQDLPQQRLNSGHHLYLVAFDYEAIGRTRIAIIERLLEKNVGTQVHYIPVYHHPYHKDPTQSGPSDFPATEAYYKSCLSLPLFPGMSDDEVEYVIKAVQESVGA
ncbi:MAG: UDP-4-amino-4,6-dideoxy-N-acetyl-beta-L-altrosamine transaminase [Mariprofundaceae bacterium]|nr:UDP-4-amino-4,6-dideoxy-N-acetyl-beta-L-altrosamine transaminase [Mariprofundaceae bacterium]